MTALTGKERTRRWRVRNPEKSRESSSAAGKKWRKKNPERHRKGQAASNKKWRENSIAYAKYLLARRTESSSGDIPEELATTKFIHLQIIRRLKEVNSND